MSRTSDCSSLNRSSDLDVSRNSSSNASHLGTGGCSPAARSRSFSITDILSDDVGGSRKRSPPDPEAVNGCKFPRTEHIRTSPGHHGNHPPPPSMRLPTGTGVAATTSSTVPHLQPNTPMMLPAQTTLLTGYPSYPTSFLSPHSGYLPYPMPTPYFQQHMNSRYVTSHLPLLGGMTYDRQGGTSCVREQMAQMKLHLSSESEDGRSMDTVQDENFAYNNVKKSSTPTILKREKKKKQEVQPGDYHHNDLTQSTPESTKTRPPFKTSPNNHHTFSPSIFLSRPTTLNTNLPLAKSPPNSTLGHAHLATSPTGTGDGSEGEGGAQSDQFVTSTPIRRGEKASFVSPTHLHSPIMSGKKKIQQQQQENLSTSEYSSCSDSEVPLLRRPKVPRRRNGGNGGKMRTPLLENTNNILTSPPPPAKARPSSLLTSYTAHHGSGHDSGIVLDHTHPPSDMSSLYGHPGNSFVPAPPVPTPNPHHVGTGILRTPVKTWNSHLMGVSGFPVYGHSPVTDHLNRTGQIQSIPPWFVCTDRKSDGKRLRLTEAINKSMAESPSQKPQLPAEWQKFAYGQTDDQKDLTSKARSFLRCRPRVLRFEGSSPS